MIKSEEVKEIFSNLGADLCGIAPAERFEAAPAGFHPTDIYTACRSVVAFAKRELSGTLFAESLVPYSYVGQLVIGEVDHLGLCASRELEMLGCRAVPIPTDDPYEHWEPERLRGMGILSMRHAGYLAGLGRLGNSTLLINEDYGNMIQIGAVLLDVELEGDPLATYEACLPDCNICIDTCPEGALDGDTVDQALCRPRCIVVNERGFTLKRCNLCRVECPHSLGINK
jgi:epoxyqueuosine reductase